MRIEDWTNVGQASRLSTGGTPVLRILTVLLLATLAAGQGIVHAYTDSASEQTIRAVESFKLRRYEEAIHYFNDAIDNDYDYAPAHYELARALSMLRAKGLTCDHDAYRDVILEHLETAIKFEPSYKEKFKHDPAFKPVHDTFRYQRLLGLSIKRTKDVKKMLTLITWYGPTPGAHGPVAGMTFSKRGKVEMWVIDANDANLERRIYYKGVYRVKRNKIGIRFKKPINGKTGFKGQLNKDGSLLIPGLLDEPFTDTEDECSA